MANNLKRTFGTTIVAIALTGCADHLPELPIILPNDNRVPANNDELPDLPTVLPTSTSTSTTPEQQELDKLPVYTPAKSDLPIETAPLLDTVIDEQTAPTEVEYPPLTQEPTTIGGDRAIENATKDFLKQYEQISINTGLPDLNSIDVSCAFENLQKMGENVTNNFNIDKGKNIVTFTATQQQPPNNSTTIAFNNGVSGTNVSIDGMDYTPALDFRTNCLTK